MRINIEMFIEMLIAFLMVTLAIILGVIVGLYTDENMGTYAGLLSLIILCGIVYILLEEEWK